jgi:hypothetical protein
MHRLGEVLLDQLLYIGLTNLPSIEQLMAARGAKSDMLLWECHVTYKGRKATASLT